MSIKTSPVTVYPAQIDTSISLPIAVDNITTVTASITNQLRAAIVAIETELGVKPSGVYGTTRARLDVLEAAINSGGGGGSNVSFAGDLSGIATHQVVTGLQNKPISSIIPSTGQVLSYNGSSWIPASIPPGFTAATDLTGSSTSQVVIGLQGRAISSTAPTDQQVLGWVTAASKWEPITIPAGFTAANDLSGTPTAQTVIAIHGTSVPASPSANNVLVATSGTSSVWQQIADSQISSSANISVTKISHGSSAQILLTNATPAPTWTTISGDIGLLNTGASTVIALQNRALVSTAPTLQQTLGWSTSLNHWEPVTPPFINIKNGPYYAVGNGSTDDSAALIAAAASGAGIIYFPPNCICKVSNNVTFPKTQTLKFAPGAQLLVDAGKTVFIQGQHKSTIDARADQFLFNGDGYYSFGFQEYEFKWFGAIGDGTTDDTAGTQRAFNAMMSAPNDIYSSTAVKLLIPPGTYNLSYTVTLIGDYFHAYELIGSSGGVDGNFVCTFHWVRGTVLNPTIGIGVTMMDFWGLNGSYFRDIVFDGDGHNDLFVGGGRNVGAGTCTWFHTNQNGVKSFPGLISAATNFVMFQRCYWTGIVGHLNPHCALGDGPDSPGDVNMDKNGNYTIYQVTGVVPPTTGKNVIDNTYVATALVGNAIGGQPTFQVASSVGFTQWMAVLVWPNSPNFSIPWIGRIIAIPDSTHITALDSRGSPIPTTFFSGNTVSTCFPNATAPSLSSVFPGATIINQPSAIAAQEVQGYKFEKCTWTGGGYDTTDGYNYGYSCISIYSGANTEQFGFEDCNIGVAGQVFGFYASQSLNNELFFHNTEFGDYSGANVYLTDNFTTLQMVQCGCESHVGFGYFAYVVGGSASITDCEITVSSFGNPFSACMTLRTNAFVQRCNIDSQLEYYDDGYAQPNSIIVAGALKMEGCAIDTEQYMVPIFYGDTEIFYNGWGTGTAPGTNRTHAWGVENTIGQQINGSNISGNYKLFNNTGQNSSGSFIRLPDIEFAPPNSVWSIGIVNSIGTAGTITQTAYRCQPRTTTTCYNFLFNEFTNGRLNYIGILQPKTIIRSMVIECDGSFTGTGGFSTLTMDVNLLSSGSVFIGSILSGITCPIVAGQIVLDGSAIPSNIISSVWGGSDYIVVVMRFAGTLVTGSLKIYFTTEVVTPFTKT